MGEGAHLRSVEAPIFRREGPGGERGPPQGQMDNDEPEFIKTLIGTRVSGSKPRQATWKSKALPMALANHETAGDVSAGYAAAASAMSRANDVTRVWARAIPPIAPVCLTGRCAGDVPQRHDRRPRLALVA